MRDYQQVLSSKFDVVLSKLDDLTELNSMAYSSNKQQQVYHNANSSSAAARFLGDQHEGGHQRLTGQPDSFLSASSGAIKSKSFGASENIDSTRTICTSFSSEGGTSFRRPTQKGFLIGAYSPSYLTGAKKRKFTSSASTNGAPSSSSKEPSESRMRLALGGNSMQQVDRDNGEEVICEEFDRPESECNQENTVQNPKDSLASGNNR